MESSYGLDDSTGDGDRPVETKSDGQAENEGTALQEFTPESRKSFDSNDSSGDRPTRSDSGSQAGDQDTWLQEGSASTRKGFDWGGFSGGRPVRTKSADHDQKQNTSPQELTHARKRFDYARRDSSGGPPGQTKFGDQKEEDTLQQEFTQPTRKASEDWHDSSGERPVRTRSDSQSQESAPPTHQRLDWNDFSGGRPVRTRSQSHDQKKEDTLQQEFTQPTRKASDWHNSSGERPVRTRSDSQAQESLPTRNRFDWNGFCGGRLVRTKSDSQFHDDDDTTSRKELTLSRRWSLDSKDCSGDCLTLIKSGDQRQNEGTSLQGLEFANAKDSALKAGSAGGMMTLAHTSSDFASGDMPVEEDSQPTTHLHYLFHLYRHFAWQALVGARQWLSRVSLLSALRLAYLICLLVSQWPPTGLERSTPSKVQLVRERTCERPPLIPLPPPPPPPSAPLDDYLFHLSWDTDTTRIPNATSSLSEARRVLETNCSPTDLQDFSMLLMALDDAAAAGRLAWRGGSSASIALAKQLNGVLEGTSDATCHTGVVAALGWIQLSEACEVDRVLRPATRAAMCGGWITEDGDVGV
ncbi:uncharacterized protein MYCFIDRAFT_84280 [Pseudocercospora fijiensis CIRAD86]|uniref:Uncharacterized protein n=1 Tax=Pseudocercospora fijiensis (strain CIRAD86) TaxID=383855 RepID=M2YH55_PSEFD|nr:uncharacterized protein MYCFIDRAFT_84280 [Pseudocercospora fijiensis CIRAD86]EME77155.1 hypothetical protein MYCFIDRAFT_84280 [Pseudocercospora fijiensis CIRAD86]